jgi:AraC-like DNA-binding protein
MCPASSTIVPFAEIKADFIAARTANGLDLPVWRSPTAAPQVTGIFRKRYARVLPHLHLLGLVTDDDFAARTGRSRADVLALRHRLGIPPRKPERVRAATVDLDRRRRVLLAIAAGMPLDWIADAVGLSPWERSRVAEVVGWDRSWVNPALFLREKATAIGRLSRADIALLHQQGWGLDVIGRLAGVSRERIRQVARDQGCEAIRSRQQRVRTHRQETQAKERAERQRLKPDLMAKAAQQRRDTFEVTWAQARQWWDEGVPLPEIARRCGVSSNSMSWTIHTGRSLYGFFPYREEFRRAWRPSAMKRGRTRQPKSKRRPA